MELIDRRAAMESLTREYNRKGSGEGLRLAWIEKAINEVPSAEPTVGTGKVGRWKETGAYPHKVYCSVCYATYVPNSELAPWRAGEDSCWKLPRNFCPNCGARMKGEADG